MGTKSSRQSKHTFLPKQDSGPKSWKPFETHARRFLKYAAQLTDLQRAIREGFSKESQQIENYMLHRSHVADMCNVWKEHQDTLVALFLDVPATKRKLLSKYVELLTETLPVLNEESKDIQANMSLISIHIKDCIKAFKRVESKLDERARWYRAHPEMKCPTLK